MSALPLSEVRINLSKLVKRAASGSPVGVMVRGKVHAWLVGPEQLKRAKPRKLGGSLKLLRPLEGTRADYLRWLRGEK